MRLLMIDDRLPEPKLGYGYCRSYKILETLLAEAHSVSFLPTASSEPPASSGLDVQALESLEHAGRLAPDLDAVWISRLSNLRVVQRHCPELLTAKRWLYDCEALHSTRNTLWLSLGNEPLSSQVFDVNAESLLWRGADVKIAASRKDALELARARVPESTTWSDNSCPSHPEVRPSGNGPTCCFSAAFELWRFVPKS